MQACVLIESGGDNAKTDNDSTATASTSSTSTTTPTTPTTATPTTAATTTPTTPTTTTPTTPTTTTPTTAATATTTEDSNPIAGVERLYLLPLLRDTVGVVLSRYVGRWIDALSGSGSGGSSGSSSSSGGGGSGGGGGSISSSVVPADWRTARWALAWGSFAAAAEACFAGATKQHTNREGE